MPQSVFLFASEARKSRGILGELGGIATISPGTISMDPVKLVISDTGDGFAGIVTLQTGATEGTKALVGWALSERSILRMALMMAHVNVFVITFLRE
jgi:hypothetical protein